MRAQLVVSAFGGFALAASLDGATRALTTMPVWLMISVALLCMVGARISSPPVGRRKPTAPVIPAIVGIFAGSMLPATAPAPARPVVARIAPRGERGDLFELLDRLDADPKSALGSRVSVTGEWTPAVSDRPASVSRRIMTCCAADQVAVGFDVAGAGANARAHDWVRVTGILTATMQLGEMRYRIDAASVSELGATPSAR